MKVATLHSSAIRRNAVNRMSAILTAILFYLAKKWNKHNKFVNFWMRSNKDITTHGPVTRAAVDMSADGRARIRYRDWVIYVGYSNRKPKTPVA